MKVYVIVWGDSQGMHVEVYTTPSVVRKRQQYLRETRIVYYCRIYERKVRGAE